MSPRRIGHPRPAGATRAPTPKLACSVVEKLDRKHVDQTIHREPVSLGAGPRASRRAGKYAVIVSSNSLSMVSNQAGSGSSGRPAVFHWACFRRNSSSDFVT